LQRRNKFENDIEIAVDNFRKELAIKFDHEIRQRNEFNETVIKYLPLIFHDLLERTAIKYEIYPINRLLRATMSTEDDDQFADLEYESVLPKSSGSEVKKENIFKPRTTSV